VLRNESDYQSVRVRMSSRPGVDLSSIASWIISGGIIAVLIYIYRVGVGLENRLGVIRADIKVLEERLNNTIKSVDKYENKLDQVNDKLTGYLYAFREEQRLKEEKDKYIERKKKGVENNE
jgi:hypothetical protein